MQVDSVPHTGHGTSTAVTHATFTGPVAIGGGMAIGGDVASTSNGDARITNRGHNRVVMTLAGAGMAAILSLVLFYSRSVTPSVPAPKGSAASVTPSVHNPVAQVQTPRVASAQSHVTR